MELGERIRQARLEAGLSQRQLCGETITRNMLSQIEHGAVQPSVGTLRFLARQLGKPVSYLLEEDTVTSTNVERMALARERYIADDFAGTMDALEAYHQPDEIFEAERGLLLARCCLALAKQAIAQGRLPYGAELLDKAACAGETTLYWGPELERERLLLLAQARPEAAREIETALPADDRELLLRARGALAAGDWRRCTQLLEAARDQVAPEWNFLQGEAHFAAGDCARAAVCYHHAEEAWPQQTAERLEQCYLALEDYKMAYFYACKQRER